VTVSLALGYREAYSSMQRRRVVPQAILIRRCRPQRSKRFTGGFSGNIKSRWFSCRDWTLRRCCTPLAVLSPR
jgi:hypothetical protein